MRKESLGASGCEGSLCAGSRGRVGWGGLQATCVPGSVWGGRGHRRVEPGTSKTEACVGTGGRLFWEKSHLRAYSRTWKLFSNLQRQPASRGPRENAWRERGRAEASSSACRVAGHTWPPHPPASALPPDPDPPGPRRAFANPDSSCFRPLSLTRRQRLRDTGAAATV